MRQPSFQLREEYFKRLKVVCKGIGSTTQAAKADRLKEKDEECKIDDAISPVWNVEIQLP